MADNADQVVTLTVGGEARVALPGRGSGGFTWSVTEAGDGAKDSIVSIARTAGERPPLPPAGGPPPNSFSLDEVLVINGLRAGTVVLDARLGRPGSAPIEQRRIRVEVAAPGR